MTSDDDLRAVWVDRDYDQEYADDGVSRYAVYLRDRPGRFAADSASLRFTDDPVRFAETCWEIGRPPVMDPPVVRAHPRVLSATASRDEWDGQHLHVAVDLVSALPAGLSYHMAGRSWYGWERRHPSGRYCEPDFGHGQAAHIALPTLTLVVPVPAARLPAPGPALADAFAALEAVAAVVNDTLRPFLTALDQGQ